MKRVILVLGMLAGCDHKYHQCIPGHTYTKPWDGTTAYCKQACDKDGCEEYFVKLYPRNPEELNDRQIQH